MIRHLIPFGTKKNKIFFVGFSNCGTTALHHFLKKNGVLSIHHHRKSLYLATIIEQNILRQRDPLKYLSGFEAFSDMRMASDTSYIEANKYFKEIYKYYPDSYFVFNDRPVDAWIKTLLKHGKFAEYQSNYFNVEKSDLDGIWTDLYEAHKQKVAEFFAEKGRFLNFNIKTDKISKLTEFLKPDYNFKNLEFERVNVTGQK